MTEVAVRLASPRIYPDKRVRGDRHTAFTLHCTCGWSRYCPHSEDIFMAVATHEHLWVGSVDLASGRVRQVWSHSDYPTPGTKVTHEC